MRNLTNTLRTSIPLLLLLCASFSALAFDFEVNGIYYYKSGNNSVAVTSCWDYHVYTDTVTIPETVTYMDNTYSVTKIGDNAFEDCTQLKSVFIPNTITYIGSSAFQGCSGLASVNIPNSVNTIRWYAFQGCSSLTSVPIPKSITKIESYTFRDCSGLTSVNVGNSVTEIDEEAFSGCSSLASVTIGNSVAKIEKRAFYGCSSLKNITIPNSVNKIDEYAFNGCPLISLEIPNSVTYIGVNAFSSKDLKTITVNSGNSVYDSRNNCNALIETEYNVLINGCQNTIIPNSVTGIYYDAFKDCSGLTGVLNIPNSVTYIENGAFSGCTGLTGELTIPNSVTYIGGSAFSGCTGLTGELTIPVSVTDIGSNAFYRCTGLETLNFKAVNCADFYLNPDPYSSSYPPFFGSSINTINIGNQVEKIPAYFAFNLGQLTSINIPSSVKSVGSYAFYNCNGLTNVTCSAVRPPATTSNCFSNSTYNTATLYVPKESLSLYWVSDGWKNFLTIEAITEDTEPADVNGDGEVTIADINNVVNAILAGDTDEAFDVNKDGEITIADINLIVQVILNSN